MRKRLAASIILYNRDGNFLLQFKDNKWDLFGSIVKDGESPDQAIVREVRDAIGFELKSFNLFNSYNWPSFNMFVYRGLIDIPISKIKFKEGQNVNFFSASTVLNLSLVHDYKNVFREYLRTKQ